MPFEKKTVVKFDGLVNGIRSELIPDGAARDILNFRFEKLGKLVSRNGVLVGLFTIPDDGSSPITGDLNNTDSPPTVAPNQKIQNDVYLYTAGIIGIGEFVLETKWEAIDTDRLMVYAIKSQNASYPAAYLFSPLTGKYANRLLYHSGQTSSVAGKAEGFNVIGKMEFVDGDTPTFEAPERLLPTETYDSNAAVDFWIDQFVRMNQYRHKLIVSDRINGDMMLVDDYTSQTDKLESDKRHQLYFKPIKLQEFNIDDVEIDTGLGTYPDGNKGINTGAVNTGMGLYKFELPKKQMITSQDNYGDFIGNQDKMFPTNISWNEAKSINNRKTKQSEIASYIAKKINTTFLSFYTFDDAVQVAYPSGVKQKNYDGSDTGELPFYRHLTIANGTEDHPDLEYTFTNGEPNTEFSDIMGEPTLMKTMLQGESEVAANVYIWDDFKIDYYASNGKEYTTDAELRYYLKDIDRIFTKVNSGIPKITKLTIQKEDGKRVPLGVYRYRFVWDMGDGVYSAPSAELVVPDIMWSATPDSQMIESGVDKYVRPRKLLTDEYKKALTTTNIDNIEIGTELEGFRFSEKIGGNWKIKATLQSFWDLKKKLYNDTHKFGAQTDTFNKFNNLLMSNPDQAKQKLDFTALVTVNYGTNLVELKGFVWDSVGVSSSNDGGFELIGYTTASKLTPTTQEQAFAKAANIASGAFWGAAQGLRIYQGAGGLVIPIFQDGRDITRNSLFDDEGRYRPSITTTKVSWIMPGMNYGVGNPSDWNGVQLVGDGEVNVWDNVQMISPVESKTTLQYSWRMTSVDTYKWSALAASFVPSGVEPNIYLNFELQSNTAPLNAELGGDKNNENDSTKRVGSIIRAIKSDFDDLSNFKSDIPSQVIDRILLKGFLELTLQDYADNFYIDTEYIDTMWGAFFNGVSLAPIQQASMSPLLSYNKTQDVDRRITKGIKLTNTIGYLDDTRQFSYYGAPFDGSNLRGGQKAWDKVTGQDWYVGYFFNEKENASYRATTQGQSDAIKPLFAHQADPKDVLAAHLYTNSRFTTDFKNVKVVLYGAASRLLALEQLTAYFPSSLLFKAPRIGFQIPKEKVPVEAKKLLVFRTKASHENDYDPNKYGLVTSLDVSRVIDGDPNSGNIDATSKKEVWNTEPTPKKISVDYAGVYFFDDVPDKKVDFGVQPSQYNGQTTQIKSAFNTALNERMYYANFKQKQDDIKPRDIPEPKAAEELSSVQIFQVNSLNGGFTEADTNLGYAIVYEDITGNKSLPTYLKTVSITAPIAGHKKAVVLAYLPAGYDNEIKQLLVYRRESDLAPYRYIGACKKEDEGIFIDNKLTPLNVLKTDANEYVNYESGLMYSEPYRPDWIKADSFVEVKSGDGKQITGMISLAGNLVIFKETSMHRYAVQGTDDPLSRNDEIDPQVGCIAPNALVNVSNTVYFLSWKGLMRYDNNRLEKIDGAFDEELQYLLKNMHEQDVRYISLGYNPYYNEIYLNLPQIYNTANATSINEMQDIDQESTFFGAYRKTTGHIYVINVDKQYITKFGYPASTVYDVNPLSGMNILRWQNNGRENLRMYYTNTLGEMRSADIFPSVFGHSTTATPIDDTNNYLWSGIYNETPYKERGEGLDREEIYLDYDETLDPKAFVQYQGNTAPLYRTATWDLNATDTVFGKAVDNTKGVFPPIAKIPIVNLFKSKYFAADDETIWKRLRKVVANIFSLGKINISIMPRRKDEANNYTEDTGTTVHSYTFDPTSARTPNPLTGVLETATESNVLEMTPDNIADYSGTGSGLNVGYVSGSKDRPLEVSLEISSARRTEIKEISFYWKPIKTYLR